MVLLQFDGKIVSWKTVKRVSCRQILSFFCSWMDEGAQVMSSYQIHYTLQLHQNSLISSAVPPYHILSAPFPPAAPLLLKCTHVSAHFCSLSLSLCPPVCCQLRLYTADFLFSSSRSASLYNAISLCSPLPGSLLCSCIWIERLLVSCHFLPLLISPTAYFVSVMATSLYFAHYLYSFSWHTPFLGHFWKLIPCAFVPPTTISLML